MSLVLASGDTMDLKDDGSSGDRQPGDGVYTVSVPVSAILRVMRSDDVQRPLVGFLDVYSGTNRVLRGNMFADVYTPQIGESTITQVNAQIQWTGHLVNIVDPSYISTGSVASLAKTFYDNFNDDEDFLNIVSLPARFQNRDHVVVRNDVSGIGLPLNDTSATYGSSGRLIGFSRFPNGDFYDGANAGYVHETGHQWINHLQFGLFASGVPHWPISTMATGTMGFSASGQGGEGLRFSCTFVDNNGVVTLTPTTAEPVFNDFDLYLMGVLGGPDVHTQYVFTGLSSPPSCSGEPFTGATSAVGVGTIVAGAGTRTPDVSTSPKRFRAATILVTRDALAPREAMWLCTWFTERAELETPVAIHEGFIKSAGNPFFVATRGLATLDTTITPPAPDFSLVAPSPAQSVARGATATFQISVMPKHGPFNQPVSITCATRPVPLPCSVDRPSVQPGDAGTDVTLTVSTKTPAAARLGSAGVLAGLAVLVWAIGGGSRRRRTSAAVALALLAGSCGGGNAPRTPTPSPSPSPTPATTYTITVDAASGALSHSVTLTLVVQ